MATANVIHDAPAGAWDHLIYPEQHPANKAFIVNQLDAYTHLLLDTGRQYFEQARTIYNQINDTAAVRAAKAALRMAKGITRPNVISPLLTLEDVRSAQPIMQRYIMACPEIRELYNNQRCDGYSDTYIDAFPGAIGETHYDYWKVMSGIINEYVDENGEDTWKVNIYGYDLEPNDTELTFDDKVDILSTWEIVRLAIEATEDCTSVYNGRL